MLNFLTSTAVSLRGEYLPAYRFTVSPDVRDGRLYGYTTDSRLPAVGSPVIVPRHAKYATVARSSGLHPVIVPYTAVKRDGMWHTDNLVEAPESLTFTQSFRPVPEGIDFYHCLPTSFPVLAYWRGEMPFELKRGTPFHIRDGRVTVPAGWSGECALVVPAFAECIRAAEALGGPVFIPLNGEMELGQVR